MTREEWLMAAIERLRPWYVAAGAPLPVKLKASCSWPITGGRGARRRTLGQCFAPARSAAGITEVFVTPWLDKGDSVLAVLVHELVHAGVGTDKRHGPVFGKVARKLGLAGPLTATEAGPELQERVNAIVRELGPYPHAAVDPAGELRKQGTRMLKAVCPECGYTIRTTAKWVERGLPFCGDGCQFELAGGQDGEGEGEGGEE